MDLKEILGDSPEMWLIVAAPLGLLLLLIVFFAGGEEQRQVSKRVIRMKKAHADLKPTPVQIISARRKTQSGPLAGLDELFRRLIPRQEVLQMRLVRAGLETTLGTYIIICGIVGVVTLSELARDRMIEFFDVTQFRRSMLHQGTDERLELIRRNIPLLIDVSFAEAA